MKIVFFGTPEYVLPVLDALHKQFKSRDGISPIVCVVTQKPKPVGRKQILTYSPVDYWAHKKGLPKFYSSQEFLNSNTTADIGILAAYGEIIPKNVIQYFRHGILNIHPSLLPKFRGASPIQAAIIEKNALTGVSIIKLDEKLDHGPIVSQFEEQLEPNDNTDSLRKRLFERGSEVLTELLLPYIEGKITPRKQNDKQATFTRQLKKDDGFIPPEYLETCLKGISPKTKWNIGFIKDFSLIPTSLDLDNFIRAMQPWPIAWSEIKLNDNKKRIKIIKTHLDESKLVIDEVQLEGKNPVNFSQLKQAYPNLSFS